MPANQVLLGGESAPLMTLSRFEHDLSSAIFENAQTELAAKITEESNHTWAYLPQFGPIPDEYPACIRLSGDLATGLLGQPGLSDLNLELAFVRVADSEPDSHFGGLHVDADIGILHERDPRTPVAAKEITRVLFNAHPDVPRTLLFAPLQRADLEARGVEIPAEQYQILDLPGNIPIKQVDIPPREPGAIHGLRFVSSQIPHAGSTNQDGHFLIAYGAYS